MKICQINCTYGTGSTGKIIRDLHLGLLQDGVDSYVICPSNKQFASDRFVYTVSDDFLGKMSATYRRLSGNQYDGALIQTNRIISAINMINPDIVHLHCINGNNINILRLLQFLKKNHIKTILTLHAEFMYTGGCGHAYECEKWKSGCGKCPILKEATQSVIFDRTDHTWKEMYKGLIDFEGLTVTSVSPWLMSRALQSPMLKDKDHHVVLNGLDTSVFTPCATASDRKPDNEAVIFHVTPLFTDNPAYIKGGNYIIELAERLKKDNIKFVIAGNHNVSGKLPDNISLLGRVTDQHLLARYYSDAKMTVITSKRETFSMVTAESLCCGTPVVGFKAGGPEEIAIKEYSSFVEYADIDALEDAARKALLLKTEENFKKIAALAASKYSKETMVREYRKIYNSI